MLLYYRMKLTSSWYTVRKHSIYLMPNWCHGNWCHGNNQALTWYRVDTRCYGNHQEPTWRAVGYTSWCHGVDSISCAWQHLGAKSMTWYQLAINFAPRQNTLAYLFGIKHQVDYITSTCCQIVLQVGRALITAMLIRLLNILMLRHCHPTSLIGYDLLCVKSLPFIFSNSLVNHGAFKLSWISIFVSLYRVRRHVVPRRPHFVSIVDYLRTTGLEPHRSLTILCDRIDKRHNYSWITASQTPSTVLESCTFVIFRIDHKYWIMRCHPLSNWASHTLLHHYLPTSSFVAKLFYRYPHNLVTQCSLFASLFYRYPHNLVTQCSLFASLFYRYPHNLALTGFSQTLQRVAHWEFRHQLKLIKIFMHQLRQLKHSMQIK